MHHGMSTHDARSCIAGWATGEGQAAGAKFGGATGARRALAWYALMPDVVG